MKNKNHTNMVIILKIQCKQANMTFSFSVLLILFFFPISRSAPHTSPRSSYQVLKILFWGEVPPSVPKAKRVLGKPQSWSAKNKIIGFNCVKFGNYNYLVKKKINSK